MKKLACHKCGNEKEFYRDVSVMAKLEVDEFGDDKKDVFDVGWEIDRKFSPIYCRICGEEVDFKKGNRLGILSPKT